MMTNKQQQTKKYLGDLVEGVESAHARLVVGGLQLDSRQVCAGDLFIACMGHVVDGRDYIEAAIAAGAVAVLAESGGEWQKNIELSGVPIIVIEQLREQVSAIAGRYFDDPSAALNLIGVTGTNGKTSCTQLMMQLLNQLGHSCGVIGTLGAGVDGILSDGENTTPDAISIQKCLAEWRTDGVSAVAMEVSSHGLDQGRVAGLQYRAALFTNISRDHLDYHGTMEAYAEAKTRLFKTPGLHMAVINLDDDYARALISEVPSDVELITYSVENKQADIRADNICYSAEGVSAELHTPWGQLSINSSLLGSFNLSNLVGVIGVLGSLAYSLEQLVTAAEKLEAIAGRMERVGAGGDVEVVVDYAHTPDALEKALHAMRLHTAGTLWCLFGCGGDRDAGKRPQMGAIAERLADNVWVTNDNPRSENPGAIINDIVAGMSVLPAIEQDREKAIAQIIASAAPGDSVLIAGKGHENYQQIGIERLPFSDIKQARLALAKRGGA